MTVDDGSRLDSRQPVDGDSQSQVTRKSLATSWLWWTTASSLVLPLVEEAGPAAFALIIGQRSIVDLRSDGAIKRTGLRSFLRGGVGRISLVRTSMDGALPTGYDEVTTLRTGNGQSLGIVGVRQDGTAGSRWRLLDGNDYYLTFAAERIGAAVTIDTGDSMGIGEGVKAPTSERLDAFERARLFSSGVVLVVPHTHTTERFLRSYVAWVQDDRPATPPSEAPLVGPVWDPAAPPDPIRYAHPVPVEADFQVTGLVQDGEWRDPSDLEAARSLLHSRFDLKLGIWDLVRNPVLRRTLLETTAVVVAPDHPAGVPLGAAERATAAVATKLDRDEEATAALKSVRRHTRALEDCGWIYRRPGWFELPLTEELRRWPSDPEPTPLVWLSLTVTKRQTRVVVATGMVNDVNLRSYAGRRRKKLENIASAKLSELDKPSPVIWTADSGWGDGVDWSSRVRELIDKIPSWASAFEELAARCRRIQAKRF